MARESQERDVSASTRRSQIEGPLTVLGTTPLSRRNSEIALSEVARVLRVPVIELAIGVRQRERELKGVPAVDIQVKNEVP